MGHRARRARRLAAAIAGALAVTAVALPGQLAAKQAFGDDYSLSGSAQACTAQSFWQPFLPWGDSALYALVPGGSFEDRAAGWQLAKRAAVTAENEPWLVAGTADSTALAVPAGGSATSPSICVGVDYPKMRFFARNLGDPKSTLRVEVLFEDRYGTARSLRIASVSGTPAWTPTAPIWILANLTALLRDGETAVAFRFTAEGRGDWRIDDVLIDPYRRT